MKNLIAAFVVMCFSSAAYAQNCESIIQLSKLKTGVIKDNETIQQHAKNFCSEYNSKSTSVHKLTGSAKASYWFLSGSIRGGSTKTAIEAVASQYCSSEKGGEASKEAYKEYIESIAPGAFSAYEQCVQMSEKSLRFGVDPSSILPNEFTISVSYRPDKKGDAVLDFSSSKGIECEWSGEKNQIKTLGGGESVLLKCERDDYEKKSYVAVINTSETDGRLTIPWPAYDKEGYPVVQKEKITPVPLDRRLSTLEAEVSELNEMLGPVNEWPGAINCGAQWEALYVLHAHPHSGKEGLSWYWQVGVNENRYVRFNHDGTYHDRSGHNESSLACENKSIDQLRKENRTYQFLQR